MAADFGIAHGTPDLIRLLPQCRGLFASFGGFEQVRAVVHNRHDLGMPDAEYVARDCLRALIQRDRLMDVPLLVASPGECIEKCGGVRMQFRSRDSPVGESLANVCWFFPVGSVRLRNRYVSEVVSVALRFVTRKWAV